MRKNIARAVLFVAAALCVAASIVLSSSQVYGATAWSHWGAAPYAASQEEACKKAPNAIDGFEIPPAVKELLKFAVGTSCSGGKEAWLTPGEKLAQMWSGGNPAHVMGDVSVAELPVLKGPDGRSYRKGSVAETAKALQWEVTEGGKIYQLFLPKVCFNWSWRATAQAPAQASRVSAAAPVATQACPEGYRLIANAWELGRLPPALRTKAEELIAAAEARDSKNANDHAAYKPSAFSRTLGGQLRSEVKTRAAVNDEIRVRLIDPTSGTVTELGAIRLVNGTGSMVLTAEQKAMIVETIWPDSYRSPNVSGEARRVRLYPEEWGSNCAMNLHGAKP